MEFVAFNPFSNYQNQFLKDSHFENQRSQCELPYQPEEPIQISYQKFSIDQTINDQKCQQGKKFYGNKSQLRNMQKNLCTFIRSVLMESKQRGLCKDQVMKCYFQLVSLLELGKYKTLSSLLPFFGNMNMQKLQKFRRSLNGIFTNQIVLEAQQILRHKIVSLMDDQSIKKYIKKTRVKRILQFQAYLRGWKYDVAKGKFTSRLSSQSKALIKKNIGWMQFIDPSTIRV